MTPTTGRRTHTPRLRQDALLNQLLGHRAEFIRFLSSRVGETAAEDILQSAYMKALEKGTQINETESAVAWFYRILRNSTIDHYRRIAARGRAHEQLAAEAPISYETELEANVCKCLSSVIPMLKDEYRMVLERVDLGGESIADFAKSEQMTPNNASVRLHRARKAAAKKLTQVCGACAEHKCLDCTCKHGV